MVPFQNDAQANPSTHQPGATICRQRYLENKTLQIHRVIKMAQLLQTVIVPHVKD